MPFSNLCIIILFNIGINVQICIVNAENPDYLRIKFYVKPEKIFCFTYS